MLHLVVGVHSDYTRSRSHGTSFDKASRARAAQKPGAICNLGILSPRLNVLRPGHPIRRGSRGSVFRRRRGALMREEARNVLDFGVR